MYKQRYHKTYEHCEFAKALVKHNIELHMISLSMKTTMMINHRNDTLQPIVGNVYWWFINVFITLPYIESIAYFFTIHCHVLRQSYAYIPF